MLVVVGQLLLLLPSMEPVKPSVRVLGFEGKSCIIDNVDVERQCVIDHGRPGCQRGG